MGKPSGTHLPQARQPRKKLQRHSLGLFPKILRKQSLHALKVCPTVCLQALEKQFTIYPYHKIWVPI
jgi:hypothetical protein